MSASIVRYSSSPALPEEPPCPANSDIATQYPTPDSSPVGRSTQYPTPDSSPVGRSKSKYTLQRQATTASAAQKTKTRQTQGPPRTTQYRSNHLSPADILSQIATFAANLPCQTKDLLIPHVPPSVYRIVETQLTAPLHRQQHSELCRVPAKHLESLRYNYSRTTGLLRIQSMPSASHEAIASYIGSQLTIEFLVSKMLSKVETEHLSYPNGVDHGLPAKKRRAMRAPADKNDAAGDASTGKRQQKKFAMRKQPDIALVYRAPSARRTVRMFPHVVFEVGFTEKYDDTLTDIREWLVASEGDIRLGIVFQIDEEDIEPSDNISEDDGDGMDEDDSLSDPDSDSESDEDDDHPDSDSNPESDDHPDSDSDPESYRAIGRTIGSVADTWFGPLTVWFEVWKYDPPTDNIVLYQARQFLFQDGHRVFPPPSLTFTRADFDLPLNPEADGVNECRLDLRVMQDIIENAKLHDAAQRVICARRKEKERRRKREGEDGMDLDYNGGGGAGDHGDRAPNGEGRVDDDDDDNGEDDDNEDDEAETAGYGNGSNALLPFPLPKQVQAQAYSPDGKRTETRGKRLKTV